MMANKSQPEPKARWFITRRGDRNIRHLTTHRYAICGVKPGLFLDEVPQEELNFFDIMEYTRPCKNCLRELTLLNDKSQEVYS